MLILYYLFVRTAICTGVIVLRLLLTTLLFYFLEPLYKHGDLLVQVQQD